jgi:hypothetical protein
MPAQVRAAHCYAWRIFLAPQYLQMIQLSPSDAGSKFGFGHDDGFDFCLAKARFVVIGFEECARATARHLSSCKIEGAQCGFLAKRFLGVDHPLDLAQRREKGGEGSRLGECGVVAEEGETSGLMGSEELAQE